VTAVRVVRDAVRACRPTSTPPGPTAVVIGTYADGGLLAVDTRLSTLVAGLPGSGKSGTLRALLAGLIVRPDVALVGIDAKGGVELGQVDRALEVLAVDQAAAVEVLARVLELVHTRARQLRAAGATDWIAGPDRPRLVVIVDELAAVVHTGDRPADRAVSTALGQVVALGRAVGVSVLAATQRPSTDVVPAFLRDLFALRICHAVARAVDARMVLGDAVEGLTTAEGLKVGPDHAGGCFVLAEGVRRPRRAQVSFIDPAALRRLAPGPRPARVLPSTSAPISSSTGPVSSTSAPPLAWPPPVLAAPAAPAPVPGPTPKAFPTGDDPGPRLTPLQARVLAEIVAGGPMSVPAVAARLGVPERRCREVCCELSSAGLLARSGTRWSAVVAETGDGGRRTALGAVAPGASPHPIPHPFPAPPAPVLVTTRDRRPG
jgi:S-DNA-T family DNA segregation ATPase FtsK/SpoIIIE